MGRAPSGRARRAARPEVAPLIVSKFTDRATPYLALASLQGKSFPEITIYLRKDSGDVSTDYLKITLDNCLISRVDMLGGEEAVVPVEDVSLTCEKINILYTMQADDHSAGDEHEITFNILAGA